MPGLLQLQTVLSQPYSRTVFVDKVLSSVFDGRLTAYSPALPQTNLTDTERKLLQSVEHYADLSLDDGTDLRCFEIRLQPQVRIEQSRVGIQQYVRKLLTAGQAVLVNFVPTTATGQPGAAQTDAAQAWRLTLVAKDTALVNGDIKDRPTNAKRYTYLLGQGQACRTAAERLVKLFEQTTLDFAALVQAFEVEKLSKDFFREYKRHYDAVNTYLTGSAFRASVFNGDEKAIRDWTRKLLGRVVFLYFVQKKGWLGASDTTYRDGNERYKQNFLTDLFLTSGANETFYPNWLSTLFFETLNQARPQDDFMLPNGQRVKVPFLNGGLFDRDAPDRKGPIPLPPRLFHHDQNPDDPAQRGFLDFLNAYNFTVHEDSPDDHTVAVDPEMLSNIFENLLEDNKDKGAFYTPRAIVHYMCRESLIEYVDTARQSSPNPLVHYVTRSELTDWVADKLVSPALQRVAGEFEKLLNDVKICDPAIGSGAFPMGLLQEIYQCLLALNDTGNHAQIKLNIIQNSIYGVDIERGAVDIARLRFWLSLVVDEDQPRALPNLDYKIVVGNSLVSKLDDEILTLDWTLRGTIQAEADIVRLTRQLSQKQRAFFTASGDKAALQRDIRDLKIDLLTAQIDLDRRKVLANMPGAGMFGLSAKDQKKQMALQAQVQGLDATLRKLQTLRRDSAKPLPYFDWRLDFPEVLNPHVTENVGFNIVIGNPPYVKEYTNREAFEGIPYYQGKMDIWYSFACYSLDMLKKNGILTFIATNNWVTNSGASVMRNKVLSDSRILKLVDFGSYMIFENASIQTMVMQFRKDQESLMYTFDGRKVVAPVAKLEDVVDLLNNRRTSMLYYLAPTVDREKLKDKFLVFGGNDAEQVLDKIQLKRNFILDERGEVAQGIVAPQDSLNKKSAEKIGNSSLRGIGIFVLTELEKENLSLNSHELNLIKPFYTSNELQRYYGCNKNVLWIIYTDSRFKATKSMDKYPILKKHLDYFNEVITSANAPYGLHRSRDEKFFKGEKIISIRKCAQPTFTFTEFDCYVSQTYYIIQTRRTNQKYLTVLLNSKLVAFWLSHKGKMQGGQYQIDKEPLLEIPLFVPANVDPFITLVNQILDAKRADPSADTSGWEAEIDWRVYHLYGLTHAEVLLVDPAFGLSEGEYAAAGKLAN